ncbi:hypothetical protein JKP88DRAFT_130126, partial [Tribonema minus]
NSICSMDALRAGGPGWFADALQINVDLATDQKVRDDPALSVVAPDLFKPWVPLVDASHSIKGTITLQAPHGRRVWITSLSVTLEEHLALLDTVGSALLSTATISVAGGRYVEGTCTLDFILTMDDLAGMGEGGLREGYIGDMLAVRHLLTVTAARPWYTFNLEHTVPLAVQRVSPPPAGSATTQGPQNEEGGPNTVMLIPDCNGRAEFTFERDTLALDGTVEGTVELKELSAAIAAAHVMIIRTEMLSGSMFETVIGEHTILGLSTPEGLANRAIPKHAANGLMDDQDFVACPFVEFRHPHVCVTEQEGCQTLPVKGNATIAVRFSLAGMPLTPTMRYVGAEAPPSGTPPKEGEKHQGGDEDGEDGVVGVRYFMRLVLEGQESAWEPAPTYWNTHEIFLYRSR